MMTPEREGFHPSCNSWPTFFRSGLLLLLLLPSFPLVGVRVGTWDGRREERGAEDRLGLALSPSLPPSSQQSPPFPFWRTGKAPLHLPPPPPLFFPPVFPPPFFSDPFLLSLSVLLSSSFQRRKLGKEKVVKAGHFPSFPPCHSSLLLLLFISPPLWCWLLILAREKKGEKSSDCWRRRPQTFFFFASYFVSQFSPPTRPFLGKEEEKHILIAPLFSASVS